jgi:multimeric flavodoxin WrbA
MNMPEAPSIVIAYFSGSGHTKRLAEFIQEGALSIDDITVEFVNVENISSINWEMLHSADAIVFGSPTHMGSVSGAFKTFMDKSSDFWIEQPWADKIAARESANRKLLHQKPPKHCNIKAPKWQNYHAKSCR